MPCNPTSVKATNPEYMCNENTNRWNLRRRLLANNNRGAGGGAGGGALGTLRVYDLLRLPQAREIRNRHRLRKMDLITAIENIRRRRGSQVRVQQVRRPPSQGFDVECKKWESQCPTDSTLEGDEWCSFRDNRGSMIRLDDWSFCTTVDEVLSLLQGSLTAFDYMIGAPRLDTPSNPYNRQGIPLFIYDTVLQKIKALSVAKQRTIIQKFPAAVMFLFNYQKPDISRTINPAHWTPLSKIYKSNFLERMLKNSDINIQNRKYKIVSSISHADRRVVWKWKTNHAPPHL